ncbi:odorant receptor 4-like [Xylocopa sonorina]|uniref:odorant receptor 4-like n=1 Tax=Xylocopa sonorina TaxID=1818115 RepID=UPI00403B1A60
MHDARDQTCRKGETKRRKSLSFTLPMESCKSSASATLFTHPNPHQIASIQSEPSCRASKMQKSQINVQKSPNIDETYKHHVHLSIQWSRWLLKPMGLWPNSRTTSQLRKHLRWLIKIACYSLISFLFVPCSVYAFLEVEDLYDKLKLFGPLIFCAMAFAKYYSLIVHENDIRECVRRIERDWKNTNYVDDRDIMILNANFGRKLVILCTFFMYSGFVFYYIAVPISVGRIVAEEDNLTFIPLVFPFSRYIVDTRYSPTNEIVFFVQMVAGALMHGITTAACSLAAVLAVHACGQMQVLMNWLDHLIDGRSDMSGTVDGRIADIVRQHVRILKFLTLTKKMLQQISFAEFLGCTLDICLVGYYVIMESKSNDITSAVTYVILLISLTFNIFIFCYIGEIVAEQCRKIGEMSYMIEWYRLPGNKKLCCVLIIAMSNSSVKLTAGNMVELSISTFTDVVKTAVAFLNVLRTTT